MLTRYETYKDSQDNWYMTKTKNGKCVFFYSCKSAEKMDALFTKIVAGYDPEKDKRRKGIDNPVTQHEWLLSQLQRGHLLPQKYIESGDLKNLRQKSHEK